MSKPKIEKRTRTPTILAHVCPSVKSGIPSVSWVSISIVSWATGANNEPQRIRPQHTAQIVMTVPFIDRAIM